MKWIVPIMGFTESASRRTGTERLWSDLRDLASRGVTVLMPWEWNDPMKALAEFVVRNSQGHGVARVFAVAYSWGAGYAFPRFARACGQLGVTIDVTCLCDPVFRSGLLPWWMPLNPLALLRGPRIGIPENVARVLWVRQEVGMPRGHEIFPEDPEATDIAPAEVLTVPHTRIDDSQAWRALVLREARAWTGAEERIYCTTCPALL